MTAALPPIDFYTYIHKSLRRQLFEAITLAGSIDFTNTPDVMHLSGLFTRLLSNLRAHGHHEENFFHPLLKRHLPQAEENLQAAHVEQEGWLEALEKGFEAAEHEPSPVHGMTFARELGRFVGHYLIHLAQEEDLTAEINQKVPREELAAAMAAFQASRSPDEAAADLKLMLPALNRTDRLAILSRLKATAPPVFIFVMDIARSVLDPRTLATLEEDLGVGSTG